MEGTSPLGLIWRVYDRTYGWLHGLQDLHVGDRPYLRIALTRYHWPPIRLADGTTLRRGERVILLHLHGPSLAALRREVGAPVRTGLAFRGVLRLGLEVLAGRLVTDPTLSDVRAVGAITHLWHGGRRFGFTAAPLRSRWWARVVARYQRRLMRAHALPRAGRPRYRGAAGRAEARLIWISAEALARGYRAGARRVPTGTAA